MQDWIKPALCQQKLTSCKHNSDNNRNVAMDLELETLSVVEFIEGSVPSLIYYAFQVHIKFCHFKNDRGSRT